MKVRSITIPETRALSSVAVQSARKAAQQGKPNPNEKPKRMLESRVRNMPWKTANNAVDITPKVIQDKSSFLLLIFRLIKLPTIAEKAPKPKNNTNPV